MLPVLTYGCEIWGSRKFDCLEKVLLKFCKGLLGVPPSATTAAVLGELGRFPIWMTTQLRVINYWMRSKLGKAPVLVQEAMKLSKAMSTLRFDSWFMQTRNIISKLGFAYRRSGNFRCKNILVVCVNHENKKIRNIFYNG